MVERVIVLSDLHLSAADAGGFDEDVALSHFLARLLADGIETELVLAGDVFDFLLDPNYGGFDRGQAVPRLARILDAHPQVVAGLRAFGARAGNSITLLSGNHDPELLLPEVHAHVVACLGVANLGEEVELAPKSSYPAVFGRAVGPEQAPIWIVHGDRWDPDNYIDRAALRETGRMKLPLGSRLVIEVLRGLRADGYEWVYWLKPEVPAVIPLLFRAVEDRSGEANVLEARGDLERGRECWAEALPLYIAARGTYEGLGRTFQLSNVDAELARVHSALGDEQQAIAVALGALVSGAQAQNSYAIDVSLTVLRQHKDTIPPELRAQLAHLLDLDENI